MPDRCCSGSSRPTSSLASSVVGALHAAGAVWQPGIALSAGSLPAASTDRQIQLLLRSRLPLEGRLLLVRADESTCAASRGDPRPRFYPQYTVTEARRVKIDETMYNR
jgi:hypothetical protein